MDKKDVLIMYFEPFAWRKRNCAQEVACKISKECDCVSRKIEMNRFTMRDKKEIERFIGSTNYNEIIAFGEKLFQYRPYIFERILGNNEYNAFKPNKNTIKRWPYFLHTQGACMVLRDMLYRLSKNKQYKWEFIHIKRPIRAYLDSFDTVGYHKNTIGDLCRFIKEDK